MIYDVIITTTLAKCQATRMPQKSNILRTIKKSKKKMSWCLFSMKEKTKIIKLAYYLQRNYKN